MFPLKKSYYRAPSWVPPIQHTTAELLDIRGADQPDREAIVVRDIGKLRQAITYGDLKRQTEQLAAGLIKRGLKKGDCVGLLCPTSVEYAVCEFALARTGAVLMRFHVSVKTGEDIRFLLKKSNCRWLLIHPGVDDQNYELLLNVVLGLKDHDPTRSLSVQKLPDLETVFIITEKSYPGTIPWTALFQDITTEDLEILRERQSTIEGDDIQGCFATSGSTGTPKLVALSVRYTTDFFRTILMRNGVTKNDRYLTDRPMAYVGGHFGSVIGVGLTYINVATQTSGPKHKAGRDFFLKVLEEEKVTASFVLSYIMRDFLKKAADGTLDLSKIKLALIGGEVIQRPLVEQCLQFVPHVINCYGSTECGLVLGTNIMDSPEKQMKYTGIACDGEFKVVDADGRIVPVGVSGELLVRNLFLFVQYWGDPEKTKAVKDERGWFKTGDMAVMNEDGYVTILGRKHEIISKATRKIWPRTIEKVVLQHPLVENVVTIGVPHDVLFEEICVCFMGKNETVADEDIKQFCLKMFKSDEAGEGLLPDYVLRFDKFPIGATGKTDRTKTKAEAMKRLVAEGESSRLMME